VETTARELRAITEAASKRELAVIRQAHALRKARGLYRDLYSTEELDLLQTARRLCYNYGLVAWGRFLTVRSRWNKKRSPRLGSTMHECPKCGNRHHEPLKNQKPTPGKLAEEKRLVEAALKRAQKARRGKRWTR
jgi:hypothetical protein